MQSSRTKQSLVRSGWLVFWILIAGLLALPAWGPSNETESWIPASPVEASSPTKSIEAVRVGDMVMARDDVTGLIVPKRVVRVFQNTSNHLRILTIRNADGATQQIKTTNEHPFFVPDRGWTLASELTPGTQLQQFDDTSAILIATHLESHPKGTPTHNVEVEDFHTYFVADTSARSPPRYLLTHNMCKKAVGDLADEAGEGLVKAADGGTLKVLETKMVPTRELYGRQLKSEFTGSNIKRLKKSMQKNGFDPNKPILITEVDGRKIIIDGHHRARAAGSAGIREVPVVIKKVSPEEAEKYLLEAAAAAENLGLQHRW